MRRYSDDDERRIRLLARVRAWTRAGLLDAEQGQRLESGLRVDVRRTGIVLRGSLALFSALVVGATVGLASVLFDVDSEIAGALLTGFAAGACFKGADVLASACRLYRYGVEESLAAAAVLLASISAALFVSGVWGGSTSEAALVAALSTAAAGSWATYHRFGFRYAVLACMTCTALVPFHIDLSRPLARVLAAALLAASFVAARRVRRRHGDEFPGDDAGVFQAAALAGIYLVANLHLTAGLTELSTPSGIGPWFGWMTWVVIWLVPVAGLRLGIIEKDQLLIDTGLALAFATVVSNKPYFGSPRQPWDPMLLGLVLIAVAIIVRRWLASAPGGERSGFTASRIQDRDAATLRALGTVSVGVHPAEDERLRPASDDATAFGGGRSGGAGAGGTF